MFGYPSTYGGAGTELLHQIDLWRHHDVEVNLVVKGTPDPRMKALCDLRGCLTHHYHPDLFNGKVVVSFCNDEFLTALPEIHAYGKPRLTIWFNCMTWCFDKEKAAHKAGLIDLFGFQSSYQRSIIGPQLAALRSYTALEGYRPYFNLSSTAQPLSFHYEAPQAYFGVGRCSRDDGAKYAADMWRIFAKVNAPRPVKTYILGWGDNAKQKCGAEPPCNWVDYLVWGPGAVPVSQFFARIHCLIHKTGGSRENWPRIVLEAFAAGVPVVVEDDYGFPDMVQDRVTGFRCKSSDEMSFRASQLAFDEGRRKQIAYAARRALEQEHGDPQKCWAPWRKLFSKG